MAVEVYMNLGTYGYLPRKCKWSLVQMGIHGSTGMCNPSRFLLTFGPKSGIL